MKNNLTIMAIDSAYPKLTTKAIEQAVEVTGVEKIVVISDQDLYPGAKWVKVDSITKRDCSRMLFNGLNDYVETDHLMIVQYDGMPINPEYWDDTYLKYDYIGASWPWLPEGQNVGNSGFSIRSKRLIESTKNLKFAPEYLNEDNDVEDVLICRHYRPLLESQGIKFAPSHLANKFSAENPGGKFDTYGFHGTLCLPFYLDDDHMEYYINNMSDQMLKDPNQTRILLGLYRAERYEHLELMMDRGCAIDPDFKQKILDQSIIQTNYLSNITQYELEDLLINY